MRVSGLLGLILLGFGAFASPALGGQAFRAVSPLRLRASDLPPGWTTLPKEVDTEEVTKLKKAFEAVAQGKEGLTLDVQGIDAAGEQVNIIFIGYPDEDACKSWGSFVQLLFHKQRPRTFGSAQAVVMSDKKEIAGTLYKKIARRHAFRRIAEVESLIRKGQDEEAARKLEALAKDLPDVAEAFLRIGDLYLFHLRPPKTDKALQAYRRALTLHEKDPMDAVLLGSTRYGEGRALSSLGRKDEAVKALQHGAEAARDLAPLLAARILFEKARIQAQREDEEGCFESLEDAFALEAKLGFSTLARDAQDDLVFEAVSRRSRFRSLVSRHKRTRPLEALVPHPVPALDLARDPIAILPVVIEGQRNAAAELESNLEKGLKSRFRGAEGFGVDYESWGGSPVRWTGRELSERMWEGLEQLGCFDMRLTGGTHDRGRGAELAAYAGEQAREKRLAPRVPARLLVVVLHQEVEGKRTHFEVTAGLVDETGKVLAATRLKWMSGSTFNAMRASMRRLGMEIYKRFDRALKK